MRVLGYLLLAILPLTSFAAKKSAGDRFENYLSKSLSASPVKLDDTSYEDLTRAPRDFTVVVLLTALEARFGCQMCRDFQPEWDVIAKSWVRGDRQGASRVVFGTLDFADGKGTFQKPVRYDFTAGPQSAEQVYGWITRHLPNGPKPIIYRPLNYVRIVATTTIILGAVSFLSIASPYILPVLQNRNLWAAISLIIILLFTSGHMFNHIRKVPYVSGDGKGGVSYFAGGFSSQFGLETQIIAAIYSVLSFATIALALKVPRMGDPRQQQVAVM
ncbi:MAG: hypothetical protein Q9187_007306, partial [Circinaria calcarea]